MLRMVLLLTTIIQLHSIKFQRLLLSDISPIDRSFIIDSSSYVHVAPAGHKGLGLFALKDIPAHYCIGYYLGELLTQKDYEIRYPKGESVYVHLLYDECQRRDRLYLDAHDPSSSNNARFINHSKDESNLISSVLHWHPHASSIQLKNTLKSIHNMNSQCAAVYVDSKGNPCGSIYAVSLVTSRCIAEGEELCFDYGDKYNSF
jgi:SET domain-containing protein